MGGFREINSNRDLIQHKKIVFSKHSGLSLRRACEYTAKELHVPYGLFFNNLNMVREFFEPSDNYRIENSLL